MTREARNSSLLPERFGNLMPNSACRGREACLRSRLLDAYSAASLSFFKARVLILIDAGLAANQRSSPENGSLPKRFFFAGTLSAVIFRRPGSVNSPKPLLCTDESIAASSAARTALTTFGSTPACSATCRLSDVLLKAVLIGLAADTVLAAGAFFAVVFLIVFFAVAMREMMLSV